MRSGERESRYYAPAQLSCQTAHPRTSPIQSMSTVLNCATWWSLTRLLPSPTRLSVPKNNPLRSGSFPLSAPVTARKSAGCSTANEASERASASASSSISMRSLLPVREKRWTKPLPQAGHERPAQKPVAAKRRRRRQGGSHPTPSCPGSLSLPFLPPMNGRLFQVVSATHVIHVL